MTVKKRNDISDAQAHKLRLLIANVNNLKQRQAASDQPEFIQFLEKSVNSTIEQILEIDGSFMVQELIDL